MELRKTRFKRNTVIHIYQNTINGGLIFYSTEDFLVFFSIFSILSLKYKVHVLGLCLMIDHIHVLLTADSYEIMRDFVKEYTRLYSKAFNTDINRKGKLFNSPFGFSCKKYDKNVRTAIAYLYNNPVEKQLTVRALDYKWNFLAYGREEYPFSEKIILRNSSWALRKAVEEIRYVCSKREPLNYVLLRRVMEKLGKDEKDSLVDYIITLYNSIDYSKCVSYYGDFDKMIMAIDSNTGSEYDIKEDKSVKTDVPYRDILRQVRENGFSENVKKVIMLNSEDKIKLIGGLQYMKDTTSYHIYKYFHIPMRDDKKEEIIEWNSI